MFHFEIQLDCVHISRHFKWQNQNNRYVFTEYFLPNVTDNNDSKYLKF